jgi:quercetin dioxygenase-like cupin family protein
MKVKHYKDIEGDKMSEGVLMRWVISEKDGAPNFYMRIVEAEPGTEGPPFHSHDYEHEMFILEGEGSLVSDEGEIPVKAGDVIFISPNENHTLKHENGLRFI